MRYIYICILEWCIHVSVPVGAWLKLPSGMLVQLICYEIDKLKQLVYSVTTLVS